MAHRRLLAQIARLGRLNARERIADLLLELLERLELAGEGDGDLRPAALARQVGHAPVQVSG